MVHLWSMIMQPAPLLLMQNPEGPLDKGESPVGSLHTVGNVRIVLSGKPEQRELPLSALRGGG